MQSKTGDIVVTYRRRGWDAVQVGLRRNDESSECATSRQHINAPWAFRQHLRERERNHKKYSPPTNTAQIPSLSTVNYGGAVSRANTPDHIGASSRCTAASVSNQFIFWDFARYCRIQPRGFLIRLNARESRMTALVAARVV